MDGSVVDSKKQSKVLGKICILPVVFANLWARSDIAARYGLVYANELTPIDQVSIVGIATQIQASTGTSNISALASKHRIPLMSEHRNRQTVIERLQYKPETNLDEALAEAKRENKVATEIISMLLSKSQGVQENSVRKTYAPWLKQFLARLLANGLPYKIISGVTNISEETLRHFREDHLVEFKKEPVSDDHQFIKEAWQGAPSRSRKNLDKFWAYLGHCHSDYRISLEQVRTILEDLGLRYRRGKTTKNIGTNIKTSFEPNSLWEGDGKQINIIVNGQHHAFCWYAFCDQNTTLIVGSSITGAESSRAFLDALKNGREQQGFYSIGILVDNRLGETDLSAVRSFCQEHGILLARTFPGNSKSNGFIENNFSIFEKFVGNISISGQTTPEIAESLAKVIVEIFTQQRNHSPRKRLGSRSPADYPTPDRPPEYVRDAIERLCNRFNRETQTIEEKWNLLLPARQHFEAQSESTQHKLMRLLGKYPAGDILSAQAKYLSQLSKYPENTYRSEYLMAIIRHNREEIAKRTFNEAWRAGAERLRELIPPPKPIPVNERAKDILEVLLELFDLPTPSEWMMELDALAWWLVHYSRQASLPELWTAVENEVVLSKQMSLKQWQEIKDYLGRKLGDFLYEQPVPAPPPLSNHGKTRSDAVDKSKVLDVKGATKSPDIFESNRQPLMDRNADRSKPLQRDT